MKEEPASSVENEIVWIIGPHCESCEPWSSKPPRSRVILKYVGNLRAIIQLINNWISDVWLKAHIPLGLFIEITKTLG